MNFEAYPLEKASVIQVSREETDGGLDDEYGLAGIISGIAGAFLIFLPFPSELRTFSMLAGGFFLVLGFVLFLLALGSSSGEIRLSLSGETGSKVITLPLDGEDFAQDVVAQIGHHQKN